MANVYLIPTSDGDLLTWTPYPASPTTHYDKVDEPYGSPDEDASYVTSNISNSRDIYHFEDCPAISGISNVAVIGRVKLIGSNTQIRATIRIGGSNYNWPSETFIGPNYGYCTHSFALNPATGLAWTVDDINNAQFGYQRLLGSGYIRMTLISVRVTYSITLATVTTQAATGVKATSATGNGNITAIGDAPVTAHGVCWNKTGTPTVSDDHTDEGAAGVGAFTSEMTGLDTGDTYYYRAYATDANGTSYGEEQTFTPDYTVPVLTTDAATDEAANSATLNGTLDDDGGQACNCGFEWGETVAYGNTTPAQSKNTGETFEQAISGLDPITTYHFRAFATNDAGTTYGADRTFTTLGTAPEVTTNEASGIGQTGARLNGVIDNDGGLSCTVYFEYGLTTAYGTTTDVQTGKVTGDTFDELLYALQPGKEYHFRAVAYNSQGTTYGLDRTFHMAALSAKARNALNKAYAIGRSET